MPNPWYTFEQNSFPGRIARAQEVNTQFQRIENAFTELGAVPAGDPTQVQFVGGDGKLAASANFRWLGTGLDVVGTGAFSGNFSIGGTLGVGGALTASDTLSVTGASTLTGNVSAGGTLSVGSTLTVTGKATSAATVGGDGTTTMITKGWAESAFAATSHTHTAGDVTSGTFANARISQASVTQHQGAIDHNALTNYDIAQHRVINDASTASDVLWSANKINNELQSIIAGENPPAGSDGMVQYNNDGLYGGQAEFTWDDIAYKLKIGTITNDGSIEIVGGGLTMGGALSVGGKATSAATAGGDGSTTLTTKGWVEATFATTSHTHAAADVTSGTFATARIPNLDAGKITTGTFHVDRIPSLDAAKITTGTFGTARIPNLDAGKITTGTFGTARIPSLDTSKITTGTFPVGRGGTGLSTYTAGNYIRALNSSTLEQRTPANVRSDIGAAATSHNHGAGDITSGTLSVTRGGTGRSSWTASQYVKTDGSGALAQIDPLNVVADIGAAPASHNHSASNITSGTLTVSRGGTGRSTLSSGQVLLGNGTGGINTTSRSGVDTRSSFPPSSHTHSAADLTTGTIPPGRYGANDIALDRLIQTVGGSYLLGNASGGGNVIGLTPSSARSMLNVIQGHATGGGNITVSTGNPSGGSNGDIHFKV